MDAKKIFLERYDVGKKLNFPIFVANDSHEQKWRMDRRGFLRNSCMGLIVLFTNYNFG